MEFITGRCFIIVSYQQEGGLHLLCTMDVLREVNTMLQDGASNHSNSESLGVSWSPATYDNSFFRLPEASALLGL